MRKNIRNRKKKTEQADRKCKIRCRTLLAIIIILLLLLLWRACNEEGGENKNVPTKHPELEFEDNMPWNGDVSTDFGNQSNSENITFPGFVKISVTKKIKEIQLYNPPENTTHFIYTIKRANSNTILYKTKAITPGNAVKWNVYDTLGVGTHAVDIEISTYDTVTQTQCTGTTNPVIVTVY